MKQKNSSSQPLTKADLESALTKYATKGDLLMVKQELKEEIVEMREEHKQYRDEVLGKFDEVMGELGSMRDENTIGSGQTSALREEVESQNKRIKHLEKLQTSVV